MQGILIALATAVTLAIAGAFAAPFLVDWNGWRADFEREISATLGLPVTIRGPIEAEILPAPRMVLRDVALGDDATSGAAVQELDAELSLGRLLRGEIEATGLTLVRPHLRLVLDDGGRISLPKGTGWATHIGIARMSVEDGTLEVRESASERSLIFTDMNLRGEARSLQGPFRLDGDLKAGASHFVLRSSLGELNGAGTGRLRLTLNGRDQPYDIALDGALRVADARPSFAGRATLAYLATRTSADGETDWQLTGDITATPAGIDAHSLALGFGGQAVMAQLTGAGRLNLSPRTSVDAQLAARSLDLDALNLPAGMQRNATDADIPAPILRAAMAARRLLPLLARLPAPSDSSRIELAAEQLAYGGALLQDARIAFTGSSAGWRIGALEAQLPGGTTLKASARPLAESKDGLESDLMLTAQDPAALLRWAAPALPRAYGDALAGPARLETTLTSQPDHIALNDLSASFGAARLSGHLSATFAAQATTQLEADIRMEGFALDALVPAAQSAALATSQMEAAVSLKGRNLSFAGTPVANLALAASAKDGGLTITHLSMNDPNGIRLEGSGALDQATAPPRGSFRLALSGPSADGLVPIAEILAGPEAAAVLERIRPAAAPVDLTAMLIWHGLEGRETRFSGTLGQITGEALFSHGPGQEGVGVDLSARMDEASGLIKALEIPGFSPRPGPARVELKITPEARDVAAISGHLALDGLEIRTQGPVRRENGRLKPELAMQMEGADLARLVPQIATTAQAPVPAALNFTLTALEPAWRLDNISGKLGTMAMSGELEITPGELPQLGGKLAFETLAVPHLLALFGAHVPNMEGPGPWSAAPFAPPMMSGVAVDMKLQARTITLLPPYAVTDGQMRLMVQPDTVEIRDLLGTFDDGRVSAGLRAHRQGNSLQASGRLMLDTVDIAALAKPADASSSPGGSVTLSLDLAGRGDNLLALVQNLSGQGTISAHDLTLPATAPDAPASVLAGTEMLETPPEEHVTARLLDTALTRGPLSIAATASTLGVGNGVVRLSPAHAAVGDVRISLGGTLDLARLYLDARVDLEQPAGAWGVAGGSILWRGALAAPTRQVTALPLATALSMRAIERETRRLEDERQREEQARERRAREQSEDEQKTRKPEALPPVPLPPPAPAPRASDTPAPPDTGMQSPALPARPLPDNAARHERPASPAKPVTSSEPRASSSRAAQPTPDDVERGARPASRPPEPGTSPARRATQPVPPSSRPTPGGTERNSRSAPSVAPVSPPAMPQRIAPPAWSSPDGIERQELPAPSATSMPGTGAHAAPAQSSTPSSEGVARRQRQPPAWTSSDGIERQDLPSPSASTTNRMDQMPLSGSAAPRLPMGEQQQEPAWQSAPAPPEARDFGDAPRPPDSIGLH